MFRKERVERRKVWKKAAVQVVQKHYVLLVILCLVAVFYGTEFGYVSAHAQDAYDFITGRTSNAFIEDVAEKVFKIDTDSVKESSKEYAELLGNATSNKFADIKGGQRGIFSSVSSLFTSGKIANAIIDGVGSVIQSDSLAQELMIIASLLITLFFWIFLKNIYIAILRRMFLEARLYDGVPVSRILHFKIVHRWVRASLTMLLVTIYEILWDLTIVGYFVKHYSYLMVPYIVAENPDIKPNDAITLSRRMMYGHKMEAFWLDFSFILWHLLGIFTFGIAEALWVVPYKTAVHAEFYAQMREEAKATGIQDSDLLNDSYLFEKADEETLKAKYKDIEDLEYFLDHHSITLPPVKEFFAKNFGIWLGKSSEKKKYDVIDNRRQQIILEHACVDGKIYPLRLNPLWKDEYGHVVHSARSLRTYTIWSIILMFFIFSFVGWSWEVGLHLIKDGVFVNRGVMHGPWLPVYGSGVAMILVVLARWRRNPAAQAVLTILLCGVVEYMTSYYLEMTKGMRWWDYTGYFLNLDGRICGEGLMVFAIGGMAAVYLLVPIFDSMLSRINPKALATISIILLLVFLADVRYSGKVPNTGDGITDYDAYKNKSYIEIISYL